MLGSGAMTNSISDIALAGCYLLIGANTSETHPVIGFDIKQAVKSGSGLVIINPVKIPLVRYADLWLRNKPGTDVALLMGMARSILDEGLADLDFINERCEGFEEFKRALAEFDLKTVEGITGVGAKDISRAASMYARGNPSSILYAMGVTQHSHGTDNVMAIANLALMTGNFGKPGSGVNPLRGQNNVQGACDMGALPDVYTGYQKVCNPDARSKFETAWGVKLPDGPGLTVTEMFKKIDQGLIKALYIVGENPVLSDPDAGHVRQSLEKLELLVVQDIFMTETARLAHVVLPAVSFAEKEGTFTNTERRVQKVRKAVELEHGKALPDWKITGLIAQQMGADGFSYQSSEEIMTEIASLTPSYAGISYKRLEEEGLQWPCPSNEHPGTSILHVERFARGKGRFMPLEYRPAPEAPDSEYPLLLTTGRNIFHYHTGTMTRKSAGLNALSGQELVNISTGDAARLKIKDGDNVYVSSRRGKVAASARITDDVPEGLAFMTFHFAESAANILMSADNLDPIAKIPPLKMASVKIARI